LLNATIGDTVKARAAVCALLLVVIVPEASLGAMNTTAPGLAPVTLHVTITDTGIRFTMLQPYSEEGHPAQIVVNGVQRGVVATFVVRNTGKKPHEFEAFGKKTRVLAPGASAQFKATLLHRGTFAYESTLDKGKRAFHGC
jgi:hypothetical protein